jgi:hypothetical protein
MVRAAGRVFNNGCAHLVRRARAASRQGNPQGAIFTEGPTMRRLFQYSDGSLDWIIDAFVRRWLWDHQGKTDTITSSYSLDDWNQIMAIGAKLGCGSQFLRKPPGSSAVQFLAPLLQRNLPEKRVDLGHLAHQVFWGLNAWRNAGLILGLRMPGLDDLVPRRGEPIENTPDSLAHFSSDSETFRAALERLRPRASAIDEAFAGKQAPSPAEYVKSLLTARERVAPIIDHDSSVDMVRTPFPRAVGWRFTSRRGTALSAVNVAEVPRHVSFPNTTGTWKDGVTGDVFAAQNNTLTVVIPAHRVRLLHSLRASV